MSWTGRQNHRATAMHTMMTTTQEKSFSPGASLSHRKCHSHLKMSLAEDYCSSPCSAPGFVLRLQLSVEEHHAPVLSGLGLPQAHTCLPVVKGQDNSKKNRSKRAERPCSFVKQNVWRGFSKGKWAQQRSLEHWWGPSPREWRSRQPLSPCLLGGQCGRENSSVHCGPRGHKTEFPEDRVRKRIPNSLTHPVPGWQLEMCNQMQLSPESPTQVPDTGWAQSSRLGQLGAG